jgi:hypothetical protein
MSSVTLSQEEINQLILFINKIRLDHHISNLNYKSDINTSKQIINYYSGYYISTNQNLDIIKLIINQWIKNSINNLYFKELINNKYNYFNINLTNLNNKIKIELFLE